MVNKRIFKILFLLIVILFTYLFVNHQLHSVSNNNPQLIVHTVHGDPKLQWGSVPLIIEDSNKKTIAEKTSNSSGIALFNLEPGYYTVIATNGYSGYTPIHFTQSTEIELNISININ